MSAPLLPRLRRAVRRTGLDVVRFHRRSHPLARRMQLLADRRIDLVLDVGANAGQYGQELRLYGYRGRLVSYEPLSAPYRKLARAAAGDPGWETAQLALGDAPGQATLHVAGNSASSSLLDMLPLHLESAPEAAYVGTEEVRVSTLSEELPRRRRPGERVYLKLDAQGFERRILAGAGAALQELAGVQLEASLTPLYAGEALFPELLALLDRAGFEPWSIEPGHSHPASGRLLQVDAIFFRREGDGR
ncbi:FkbM family methyltransferase [Anaeromyxobacter paludicola]|uniref:FkbM family methyltransferase n=1 Tax=Anaeromyxobacter paludicola TaxID=2918171 RepID=UPI0020C0225C|nr:FkbM family methyltransferase [Anaeromyxobacter paludicola]